MRRIREKTNRATWKPSTGNKQLISSLHHQMRESWVKIQRALLCKGQRKKTTSSETDILRWRHHVFVFLQLWWRWADIWLLFAQTWTGRDCADKIVVNIWVTRHSEFESWLLWVNRNTSCFFSEWSATQGTVSNIACPCAIWCQV